MLGSLVPCCYGSARKLVVVELESDIDQKRAWEKLLS